MAVLILFVGLGIIVVAAVAARIQERPSFDRGRTARKRGILPETDLQIEGLARAGELPAAIAMYVRVHRVDRNSARRAVMALAGGGAISSRARAPLSPKSKIGQIVLGHLARVQAQSAYRPKSGVRS
jgi:hypothetical protein